MVQAARRHPLFALPFRAEKSPSERNRRLGHGSAIARASRRLGPGQHGQFQFVAIGEQGEGARSTSEETQAPAPVQGPRYAAHHTFFCRHRQEPFHVQK